MAVLSLPLSFNNSFWSQDYRKGVEVLFQKLEQGVAENDEIIAFVRARAVAESQLAISLMNPAVTGPKDSGFGADDGATLLMAFRGLQAESAAQGQLHKNIAQELTTLVADPFEEWANGYRERIVQSKGKVFDQWLRSYEHGQGEVAKLKHQYLAKVRKADEAEDDAKFAPNSGSDHYTTSPRLRPIDARADAPQRTSSVSERIAARLKDIQKRTLSSSSSSDQKPEPVPTSEKDEEPPKVDKGKGKAVEFHASPIQLNSPLPMSPPLPPKVDIPGSPMPPMPAEPMLLAGLSLPPSAVSQLLTRAASELNMRPVRFPLLGEYKDCFTGEEFVAWLNENVQGFGGSLDRAEQAAKDLTERDNLLRRIGELGNEFEHSDEAFYQFRPKAFDIEGKNPETVQSPIKAQQENLIKRTNTFFNVVSKALNATGQPGQPAHVKARHEAEEADKIYRVSVRQLDRQRLGLEERLEDTFKTLQRWETERLRAVKTVLLQYQGTLANLPKSLEPIIERQGTSIAAYMPESDLTALIERYRTGPFRPDAQVYESVSHDESDVLFGIDLRKWAEGGWNVLSMPEEEKKQSVPPVVTALLTALTAAYEKLPNDAEKRKSWIYEVPLSAVHHLREVLNAIPPGQAITEEVFAPYDAPVLAAAIKLWLLELDPPIALYEGWEDFRKLYPTMGNALVVKEGEANKEQKIQEVGTALQRLPKAHLYVLDAIVSHLKNLMAKTKVDESDEVYITKLALSIGRTIVRPKFETEITIQDRHPTLLFIDLLKDYEAILPPTIARKKRESERKIPIRKRTAPIDMRLSRSRISIGADAKQLLAAQHAAQNPSIVKTKSPPPVPPLPAIPPPPPIVQPTPIPPPPPPIQLPSASPPAMPSVPPPPPLPTETSSAPPPVESSPIPPPPVESSPIPPPPPPVAAPAPVSSDDLPPRPSFKTPPPEDDDLPPRPAFKDPPPEPADDATPPMPNFAEPPAEESDSPSASVVPNIPPPVTAVTPPTPSNGLKRGTPRNKSPPSKVDSRSASPSIDETLSTGKASISRSGSGGVRGPRLTRGPRAPGGGNVSSMVSNINRNSIASSPTSSASPTSPTYKRLSGGASPSRRPSSVLGRSSAFSRRTMASDAEDEVVDK